MNKIRKEWLKAIDKLPYKPGHYMHVIIDMGRGKKKHGYNIFGMLCYAYCEILDIHDTVFTQVSPNVMRRKWFDETNGLLPDRIRNEVGLTSHGESVLRSLENAKVPLNVLQKIIASENDFFMR